MIAKDIAMIDMNKINKLIDLIRRKDWLGAHAMLDENEMADPGEGTVAHWRSVVLRDEGRRQDALQYLADNLHRFDCKAGVFHKRAELFHELGNDSAALEEIEKAPFDSEIEDHWALVMEAKFFRLHLMAESGLPIPPEQWAEIPDDYISLMPTGKRVSKEQLVEHSKRR
jgi:hypothetical protein